MVALFILTFQLINMDKEFLEEACAILGREEQVVILPKRTIEIKSYRQVNKTGFLILETSKTSGPDDEVIKTINNLPITNYLLYKKFFTGLRPENGGQPDKSYYHIGISIKKEHFNGEIDASRITGEFLQFCKDRNINSTKDLMLHTVSMVRNMANYTYQVERHEKKILRSVKKNYLKFLYKHKLIESIQEQQSNLGDVLVKFTVNGEKFHLRKIDTSFITDYDSEVGFDCNIYRREEKTFPVENMDFNIHMRILVNINDSNLVRTAELELEEGVKFKINY